MYPLIDTLKTGRNSIDIGEEEKPKKENHQIQRQRKQEEKYSIDIGRRKAEEREKKSRRKRITRYRDSFLSCSYSSSSSYMVLRGSLGIQLNTRGEARKLSVLK